MKKTIFLLLTLTILFVMAACGNMPADGSNVADGGTKQTGKIVVNENTQNAITKTHTHNLLKAVDFGFRTKRKDKLLCQYSE